MATKRRAVRWVRHPTVRSVVFELSNGADDETYLRLGGGWGVVQQKEVLRIARRMRYFGFFRHATRTIHWWAAKNVPAQTLFNLFFHEAAHGVVRKHGTAAHRKMAPFERAAAEAWKQAKKVGLIP